MSVEVHPRRSRLRNGGTVCTRCVKFQGDVDGCKGGYYWWHSGKLLVEGLATEGGGGT